MIALHCKHCGHVVFVNDMDPDWETVVLGHMVCEGHVFQVTDEDRSLMEEINA